MDEAIERLVDPVVVRENVTREAAEMIVYALLEELRRMLDEHPVRLVKITLEDEAEP